MKAMRRSVSESKLPFLLRAAALAVCAAGTATAASAQTLADYDYDQLTFRGVGLGFGFLWSDQIEDTEQYSLRVDLGYLGPGVRIVPGITYWKSEVAFAEIQELANQLSARTGSVIPAEQLAPIEWSDLALDVDAHFVWSTPLGVLTYIGTGLGLHALNGQGPAVDDTFVEDLLDDVTVGINGIVGLEIETSDALRVFGEGRYTAMSSLRYATLRGGVQIMFSRGDVEVGAAEPAPPVTGRAP